MKKILFLVAILTAPGAVPAADEEALEAAGRLLEIVGMEETLERSIDQMMAVQLQRNSALVPYEAVMSEFLGRHMSFDNLKSDMAELYADAFTVEELREIIAFYRSPVGRKATEVMPALMDKGARLGAERVRENIGELEQMIQAESERIRMRGLEEPHAR